MKVNKKDYSTIWFENNKIKIIDQTKLPFKFEIKELKSLQSFVSAIKKMEVRGAPLIGVTAAYGLAFEILREPSRSNIFKTYKKLFNCRPTAVNLRWALDEVINTVLKIPPQKRGKESLKIAHKIRNDDIKSCKQIGKNGLEIIQNIYKKKKDVSIFLHIVMLVG
jgi:methylthioribose-1-phosphate isomerase